MLYVLLLHFLIYEGVEKRGMMVREKKLNCEFELWNLEILFISTFEFSHLRVQEFKFFLLLKFMFKYSFPLAPPLIIASFDDKDNGNELEDCVQKCGEIISNSICYRFMTCDCAFEKLSVCSGRSRPLDMNSENDPNVVYGGDPSGTLTEDCSSLGGVIIKNLMKGSSRDSIVRPNSKL